MPHSPTNSIPFLIYAFCKLDDFLGQKKVAKQIYGNSNVLTCFGEYT